MKRPLSLILCFLIPSIVLMFGLILGGVYAFQEIPRLFHESARGEVSGGFPATLEEPGKYTVWLEVKEEDLRIYREKDNRLPPGASVHVFDANTGKELELTNWISSTKSIGEVNAISLGTFLVQRSGQEVEVKGSGFRAHATASISPTNTNRTLRIVLTIMGIIVVSITVSIFLFMILLHRRQKMLEEPGVTG